MALHHAGGRDLSSSWAAIHFFGSRQRLRAWLQAMRVEDDDVRTAVLASVSQEPYVKSGLSFSGTALLKSQSWCKADDKGPRNSGRLRLRDSGSFYYVEAEDVTCSIRGKTCKEEMSPKSFDEDLTRRVWTYFWREAATNGSSISAATKANGRRWFWMTLLLAGFSVSYAKWVTGTRWITCIVTPAFGQLVAFSVMHDASHSALSSQRWINVLGSYGGSTWTSPHEWIMQHVLAHHMHPNVHGEDPDVVHVDRYRNVRRGAVSLYAIVVWLVALPVGLTTLAPLRVLRDGCYPASTTTAPEWTKTTKKITLHILGRILYIVAFIIAPAVSIVLRSHSSSVTDAKIAETKTMSTATYPHICAFFKACAWIAVPQFVGSAIFMAVTQIAHLIQVTYEDAANVTAASWYEHQVRTACNYAADSRVHYWLTGGLNLQIEHHLFPTVNHCHLSRLRPMVKAACRDWCVPYREVPSMATGVVQHLTLLRKLARRDPVTSIFSGKVWQMRNPIADEPRHNLMQRHNMWLFNLDDPDSIPDAFPLSFDTRDHLRSYQKKHGRLASSIALADAVREVLNERFAGSGIDLERGHIEILTVPRYFGYTFTPISVYFAYDASSKLTSVIFEVSNTPWHDDILYAHRVDKAADGDDRRILVFHDVKQMYVSPFQSMSQTYEWHVTLPTSDALALVVRVSQDGINYFEAGFRARREPRRDLTFIARWCHAMRLAPQRAAIGIHIHAAHLLAKGTHFYPHPHGEKTPLSRTLAFLHQYSYVTVFLLLSLRILESFTFIAAVVVIFGARAYDIARALKIKLIHSSNRRHLRLARS